jgi:predicted regulator of Ras-like GTPase activity (Roadblock/LC7/MglB family)
MNGLLCDLITQTGAEIALLVRSEGALIARAGNMDEIEEVGMLAALIYGASQTIAASLKTSVSYLHQHGDQQDLLILRIDGQRGLVVAFKEALGLGGSCIRRDRPRWRCANC